MKIKKQIEERAVLVYNKFYRRNLLYANYNKKINAIERRHFMLTLQEQVVQKVNGLSEDNLRFLLEMIERFMQPAPASKRTDEKSIEIVKGQGLYDNCDKPNLGDEVRKLGYRTAEADKMKAFLELEEMLVPVSQELDYEKELAEARDDKYGNID